MVTSCIRHPFFSLSRAFVLLCSLLFVIPVTAQAAFFEPSDRLSPTVFHKLLRFGIIPGDQWVNSHERILVQLVHLHGLFEIDQSNSRLVQRQNPPNWYLQLWRGAIIELIIEYGIPVSRETEIETRFFSGTFSTRSNIVVDLIQFRQTLIYYINNAFENEENYIAWVNVMKRSGMFPENESFASMDQMRNSLPARTFQIETALTSSFLYSVLHELGHIVLGHHDQLDPNDCEQHHRFELEADRFAFERMWEHPGSPLFDSGVNVDLNFALFLHSLLHENASGEFVDTPDYASPVGFREAILPYHSLSASCTHASFDTRLAAIIAIIRERYHLPEIVR